MNLIVCIDANRGIGNDNHLLFNISEDKAMFKNTTMGKTVVMGRKTLESLPDSKPLPGRTNIVLTWDEDYTVDGAIVLHSKEQLLQFLEDNCVDNRDVYIMGGVLMYELMMDHCDTAIVTKVPASRESDAKFPVDLDDPANGWKSVYTGPIINQNYGAYVEIYRK